MDEVKKDIKAIEKSLHGIDKTLVKQEMNLQHHMRRTELAEKRLEHIEAALEPVKKHISGLNGVFKLLGVVAVIVSILKAMGKI